MQSGIASELPLSGAAWVCSSLSPSHNIKATFRAIKLPVRGMEESAGSCSPLICGRVDGWAADHGLNPVIKASSDCSSVVLCFVFFPSPSSRWNLTQHQRLSLDSLDGAFKLSGLRVSQSKIRKRRDSFSSQLQRFWCLQLWRRGTTPKPRLSHEGQAYTALRQSPLYAKDASR